MRWWSWAVAACAALCTASQTTRAAPRWDASAPAVFQDSFPGSSHDVELADLNGDGRVDLLFANTRGFNEPDIMGASETNQAFVWNDGAYEDVSPELFPMPDTARVLKAHDFNGDGLVDVFVGACWTQSSTLLVQTGEAHPDKPWLPVFDPRPGDVPPDLHSVGDVAVGDIDDDGDLDLLLSDWGDGPVYGVPGDEGAWALLWINEDGVFTDETLLRMPLLELGWSWSLALIDLDNDFDLDLVASGRGLEHPALRLYQNDGLGNFTPLPAPAPATGAPVVRLLPAPLEGSPDATLDVLLLRQDAQHLALRGDGESLAPVAALWPDPSVATHVAGATFSIDQDAFTDALIWDGGDPALRVYLGSETALTEEPGPALADPDGVPLDTTRDLAVAHLGDPASDDYRLDVVTARGGDVSAQNWLLAATDQADPDQTAPVVTSVRAPPEELWFRPGETFRVRARVHDHKWPQAPHDWSSVRLEWQWGSADEDDFTADGEVAGRWFGEHLWRFDAEVPAPAVSVVLSVRVCAVDLAGNGPGCSAVYRVSVDAESATASLSDSNTDSGTATDSYGSDTDSLSATDSDADTAGPTTASATDSSSESETASDTDGTGVTSIIDDDGCGCAGGDRDGAPWSLLFVAGLLAARRRV